MQALKAVSNSVLPSLPKGRRAVDTPYWLDAETASRFRPRRMGTLLESTSCLKGLRYCGACKTQSEAAVPGACIGGLVAMRVYGKN